MTFDWTKATVKVTVPVQHTATTETQDFDIPLKQLSALLHAMRADGYVTEWPVPNAFPPAKEGK